MERQNERLRQQLEGLGLGSYDAGTSTARPSEPTRGGVLGQTLISMMIPLEDGALGQILISKMIDIFFLVV